MQSKNARNNNNNNKNEPIIHPQSGSFESTPNARNGNHPRSSSQSAPTHNRNSRKRKLDETQKGAGNDAPHTLENVCVLCHFMEPSLCHLCVVFVIYLIYVQPKKKMKLSNGHGAKPELTANGTLVIDEPQQNMSTSSASAPGQHDANLSIPNLMMRM